jgi:hypothetical protein
MFTCRSILWIGKGSCHVFLIQPLREFNLFNKISMLHNTFPNMSMIMTLIDMTEISNSSPCLDIVPALCHTFWSATPRSFTRGCHLFRNLATTSSVTTSHARHAGTASVNKTVLLAVDWMVQFSFPVRTIHFSRLYNRGVSVNKLASSFRTNVTNLEWIFAPRKCIYAFRTINSD